MYFNHDALYLEISCSYFTFTQRHCSTIPTILIQSNIRLLCCVVLCCGVVWCGVVWCGVVWCGVVCCVVLCCVVLCCGVVWCGVLCCVVLCCVVLCCVVLCCVRLNKCGMISNKPNDMASIKIDAVLLLFTSICVTSVQAIP
jgi:hypothetical protein